MILRRNPGAPAVALATLLAAIGSAPAAAQSQTSAAPKSEAQALADLLGVELPKFPEGAELQPLLDAAAAYPLGSPENPVRLGSIRASYIYVGRLRCADGARPTAGRLGQGGKMPFGRIIDAYKVDCGRQAPGSAVVNIDPYHPGHDETRAPPGFTLAAAAPQR